MCIAVIFTIFFFMSFSSAVVVGSCEESQEIMALYSSQNTHGEVYNGLNLYGYEICYNDIFGKIYGAANPHTCTETNTVLWLSGATNAHASADTANKPAAYSTQVCYGDLKCTARTTSCEGNEKAVVYLSGETNAHLGKDIFTGLTNYIICCTSNPIDIDYYCGDGLIKNTASGNPINEQCELPSTTPPSVAPKKTCTNLGFTGGTLRCDESCQLDISDCAGGCIDGGSCGDSNLNCGEQCTGTNLRGLTCGSLGYEGGILGCTSGCKLDTSACTTYAETLLWVDAQTGARGIDEVNNNVPIKLLYEDASLASNIGITFKIYRYNDATGEDILILPSLTGTVQAGSATAVWTAKPVGKNYWFEVYKNNIKFAGRRSNLLEVRSEISPTSTGCGQFKTETKCNAISDIWKFKDEICDGMSTSECKAEYSRQENQFNLCVNNPDNYRYCKCTWTNNRCVFTSQSKNSDGDWVADCETTLKIKEGALCTKDGQEYVIESTNQACRGTAILPCGIEIAELPFFGQMQFIIAMSGIILVYAWILEKDEKNE